MLSSGTMSPRRGLSASWNEKNHPALPLPSASKRARPLSVPARIKRRWPLLLAFAVAALIAMSYFSTPGQGLNDSRELTATAQTPERHGEPGSVEGFEREAHHEPEEAVMATDDLFVQRLEDTKARTPKQVEADEEAARVRKETEAEAKHDKLRALVWWIARGGMFPADYRHPSAATLKKMNQKAFEDLLVDIEGTDENVFLGGWESEADLAQRVTVFSKVSARREQPSPWRSAPHSRVAEANPSHTVLSRCAPRTFSPNTPSTRTPTSLSSTSVVRPPH